MIPTILHRYYLKELMKVFALVLGCLFGLYVLIDYTSRASSLKLSLPDLGQYYLFTFVDRLDILVPFALLISGIKVLCQSNLRQELVAMRASGFSSTRLLSPMLWAGLAATMAIYLNTQYFVPDSTRWINMVEELYTPNHSGEERRSVHKISLTDGSRLLFLGYDHSHNLFLSSYWVRSLDDIYRIKRLSPYTIPPTGYLVEHLTRDQAGHLVPAETYEKITFADMEFDPEELQETVVMPNERSLVQLWQHLPADNSAVTYEKAQIEAAFYKKMAMPWLCLIALLAPAPFCVVHRRPLRVLFIFAGSIFALFALFILLSVGNTLAQSQLVSPLWTLALPMVWVTSFSLWRFFRMG